MIEKMKSGIYGFVVGDALGVPVEFLNRTVLQKKKITEMMGYGSHNVPEGTWSDDTSLMLATMDSIKEKGNVDFEDIMYKFTEWVDKAKYTATNKLFDIGISTSSAIRNYKLGNKATECGMRGINENGNGSLMRILPLIYYIKINNIEGDEKVKLINQASSLTHAHEISKLGCLIFTDYILLLLDGVDKDEALRLVKESDYSKYYSLDTVNEYQGILKDDIKSRSIDRIKSTGYVVHSLEASLWCTLNSNSFEQAVINAVNLGEDTDTIGAITGSLNGIIYGMESIPKRWLDKIQNKNYLDILTEDFIQSLEQKSLNL